MGYLISCRMPGCEWGTKNPGEYVHIETLVIQHLVKEHTPLQVAEALVSLWQFSGDGRRQSLDPLVFVNQFTEEEAKEPPIIEPKEPRAPRRSTGRKSRFDKTYSQMIRDAFDENPGGVLTTAHLREYIARVTNAIIPAPSVSATLHKMCENEEVEHVSNGQWKRHVPSA